MDAIAGELEPTRIEDDPITCLVDRANELELYVKYQNAKIEHLMGQVSHLKHELVMLRSRFNAAEMSTP